MAIHPWFEQFVGTEYESIIPRLDERGNLWWTDTVHTGSMDKLNLVWEEKGVWFSHNDQSYRIVCHKDMFVLFKLKITNHSGSTSIALNNVSVYYGLPLPTLMQRYHAEVIIAQMLQLTYHDSVLWRFLHS